MNATSEGGSASHFDLSHLRSGCFCAVTMLYAVGFLGGSLLNSRDLCDVLPGSEKGEHNAPQRRVGIKDPPRSQEPTTSHFLPSPFNERPDARTNLHEPPPSWSIRPRNPKPLFTSDVYVFDPLPLPFSETTTETGEVTNRSYGDRNPEIGIAPAMQLQPELGNGADAAWLVRS